MSAGSCAQSCYLLTFKNSHFKLRILVYYKVIGNRRQCLICNWHHIKNVFWTMMPLFFLQIWASKLHIWKPTFLKYEQQQQFVLLWTILLKVIKVSIDAALHIQTIIYFVMFLNAVSDAVCAVRSDRINLPLNTSIFWAHTAITAHMLSTGAEHRFCVQRVCLQCNWWNYLTHHKQKYQMVQMNTTM